MNRRALTRLHNLPRVREWLLPLTVLLVVLVIIVLEVTARKHEPRIEDSRFLVARRDLKAGLPIYFLDYTIRFQGELAGGVPEGAFTDQDWHRIGGRRLRRRLQSGEVLTIDNIVGESAVPLGRAIPMGQRAYSFPVVSAPRLVGGDRIDIHLKPRESRGTPVTLLEGVTVLEVERTGEGSIIVAGLSSSQIEILEHGRQSGDLSAALRNPDEISPSVTRKRKRARMSSRHIPVFTEAE